MTTKIKKLPKRFSELDWTINFLYIYYKKVVNIVLNTTLARKIKMYKEVVNLGGDTDGFKTE